jgi:hypothetical protein
LSYADPAAIGGKAFLQWNPEAAADSIVKVVAFLRQNVAGSGSGK